MGYRILLHIRITSETLSHILRIEIEYVLKFKNHKLLIANICFSFHLLFALHINRNIILYTCVTKLHNYNIINMFILE